MAMSKQAGPGLGEAARVDAGISIPVLIGAVVGFSAIGLAARYAPDLLASLVAVSAVVALLALGARGGRGWGVRRESGWAGPEVVAPPPTHSEGELGQWVAGLLGSFHYQLQRVEPAGWMAGAGLELVGRGPSGELIVVRCQSYAAGDRVGAVDMLRLMAAVLRAGAEGGILVTTTSFTPTAITLAGFSPAPIALYDGSALARPEWAGAAA